VITCPVTIACAEGSIYHLLRMRRKLSICSSVHERRMSLLSTTFCNGRCEAKDGSCLGQIEVKKPDSLLRYVSFCLTLCLKRSRCNEKLTDIYGLCCISFRKCNLEAPDTRISICHTGQFPFQTRYKLLLKKKVVFCLSS